NWSRSHAGRRATAARSGSTRSARRTGGRLWAGGRTAGGGGRAGCPGGRPRRRPGGGRRGRAPAPPGGDGGGAGPAASAERRHSVVCSERVAWSLAQGRQAGGHHNQRGVVQRGRQLRGRGVLVDEGGDGRRGRRQVAPTSGAAGHTGQRLGAAEDLRGVVLV